MKQVVYSMNLKSLVVALGGMLVSITASAQKFETHKVVMADNGIATKSVKIKPVSTFSVKKDNRVKWITFETDNKSVTIKATANTTKNSRSCDLVLLDEKENAVDTLKVEQNGKISTSTINSASRLAGSTTRGSSTKSVSGGQCAARTKKGSRCSRKAAAGSIYCWQHNK